jgi:hypothetical protein
MKLTWHSRNRLLNTFALHEVPKEYADPLYNYLVHGFQPGSFWTAVLSNDFARAIASSHPQNSVPALKRVVTWLNSTLEHGVAWGTREAVQHWLMMTPEDRRQVLETNHLVYTEQEEVILILKDEPTREPILW